MFGRRVALICHILLQILIYIHGLSFYTMAKTSSLNRSIKVAVFNQVSMRIINE